MRVQLLALTIARLFLNTGLRMVYPFIPALARGLGVEITAVYRLVTFRNFAGLLSPVFGPLSERYGRKPIIIIATLLFALGCLIVVVWPAYWGLGATLIVIGIAKVIFDPAMQAYIGDTVPYQQRGRALALTETSWAGGLLVGAPAIGFAIQTWGWRAPFVWLGGLAIGAALLLWRTLPRIPHAAHRLLTLRDTARTIRQHPVIWAAALYTLLAMCANEIFFIVYGDWMEASFALSLASLGLASGIIGGAEISGEVMAGFLVDRFGKRPVIITAGLLNAAAYFIIPYTAVSLSAALVTLVVLSIFFEITLVGGVPLLTELVPGARSVVMAVALAAGALGRAIGSLAGPLIWEYAGFRGSSVAATAVMFLGILVLARWVKEFSPASLPAD
ncbi:MAG: MFS transporter [Ardenticatenaceae bacterium]|nr:MFS transporter [Anaerolineales bacterium]MCB8920979.1 MFS transporter [Ardenticatenaceae bacterium]MCB8991597.1 MFS transporter [Ardenticatenaceae bacterium]MCB9004226.1 MFS transporter [Ardenticatenaceae bacterium]